MHEFFWKHDVAIKILLVLAVAFLGFNSFVKEKPSREEAKETTVVAQIPKEVSIASIDTCGDDCKKTIDQKVAEAIATLSAKKTTSTTVATKVTSTPQTSIITLDGGTFTTTNTDWTDVKTSDTWIDIGDYGTNPTVVWEATLKGGTGGTAYARVFDVTHGIAVSGSEISGSSSDFALVSSDSISLWSGRNLYRVQVKSLNSYAVSFGSGKVKITTK